MSTNKENEITISIETSTMVKGLGLIAIFIILLNTLHTLVHPFILIAVALFLALALNPSVEFVAKKLKKQSRLKATSIVYVGLVTFLVAFFSIMMPPLISQTIDFIQEVPTTIKSYKTQDSSVTRVIKKYNLQDDIDNIASDFGSHFSDISKPALATASTIGSTLVSTFTVLVLAFMMLLEGPRWLERYWSMQPASKREGRKKTAQRLYRVVTGYVNGQVLVAAIGATFAFIALVILSQVFNVTVNAVALAAIIFLFALLPLIGTTLGSIIVVTATLFVSVPLALSLVVYFIIYQQIENVTIQPYIQSKTNSLTPLIVFIAALIGVSIGGIMGALFAIPAAGCIKILVERHYHERLAKADKS